MSSQSEKWREGPGIKPGVTRIPELDALRALASLSVLGYHFLPHNSAVLGHLPEIGWMGVDFFFVLSGYLITGILLEARGGAHYYGRFYLRRALRILPLYYLVLGGALLFAKLTASGVVYRGMVNNWGSPLWYWFYAGNIRMAVLNTGAPFFALGPFWSVHVEEQFYLLYPMVIAFVPRRHLRKALMGAIAAALALRIGLVLTVPGSWAAPNLLMPCRMDNLAMGALIADYVSNSQWPLRSKHTLLLAVAGIVMIAVLVHFAGTGADNVAMITLGFTLNGLTCMMILAWVILNTRESVTRFLRFRPLCAIGTVSYGIYLLHVPVSDAVKLVATRLGYVAFDKTFLGALVYTAFTIMLAAASYFCVEEPILQARTRVERWFYRPSISYPPEVAVSPVLE